jgi:8-oxo-dGTP diphosphatase
MVAKNPVRYVVGFLFSEDRQRVVLIEKKRPAWQAGRLNGVGGHVEEGETPMMAMVREFEEEAGLSIPRWEHFAVLTDAMQARFHVDFFRAFGDVRYAYAVTDELIQVEAVNQLPPAVLPNLRWLIPMALSVDADACKLFHIEEMP